MFILLPVVGPILTLVLAAFSVFEIATAAPAGVLAPLNLLVGALLLALAF